MYVDANNLYRYAMSKKLPIDNFKWDTDLSIVTEEFIKNYNEKSDTGYLLVVDAIYPENLYKAHSGFPFLLERGKVNKVNKLLCSLNGKKYYYIHSFALKQAIDLGSKLEKVHSVISFRQDAWLKSYIDMNTQ